ncbi:MAG: cell division protein ZapA [Flavobacteriales bacterium]|nr:cell division protein ZapA [Flavobacteriales bacterium]MCX7769275.1 cell division protein ZapA [Flavobacteriales bacterium]MDW8409990.1 cell division protein ZapA [Flavobacteriales bacterium]
MNKWPAMPDKPHTVLVKISGKDYRLVVGADQETTLLRAADIVNAGIEKYKQSPSVSLLGDALALCALELAMRLLKGNSTATEADSQGWHILKELDRELSEYLALHVKPQ